MKVSGYTCHTNYTQRNNKTFLNSIKEECKKLTNSKLDFLDNEILRVKKVEYYNEMNAEMVAQVLLFHHQRKQFNIQNIRQINSNLQFVTNFKQIYEKIYGKQ